MSRLKVQQVNRLLAIHDELLKAAGPRFDGKPRRRVPDGRAIRERLGAEYGISAEHIKHIWGGRAWL